MTFQKQSRTKKMAIPEKYSHIDFTPPNGVRKEAENGLKLRREHGRGGTSVGIARARDLSNGKTLSPSTVRRMKAFFDRHQSDKSADGFDRGDKDWPSNGLIASKLWGHDSGYSWAKKVVAQMNAADEKEGRSLRPKGSSFGLEPRVVVVHGPPSIKKSEYIAAKKSDDDVVFDFNKVMDALSGGGKKDSLISYCTDIRTLIIDRAIKKKSSGKTWIIATRVSDEMRGRLSDINVDYVYIDTPKEDCLKEIEGLGNEQEMRQVIEDYFTDESESRFTSQSSGVERRFVGNFASEQKTDPELLRIEHRADPGTGQRKTYIVGYAARFHTDSLLLGDFVERIDPNAFDLVNERQDSEGRPLETRCLYNHDPNHLLGRFPTTMRLTVDKKGLRYECLLPESRQDIAESVERGDLKGSSFSFICAEGGERWSYENGVSTRLVTKIKALLDCGPVTYPAYGDATVAVAQRSYEQYRAFCATGDGGGVDNTCSTGTATAAKKASGGGKKKAATGEKKKAAAGKKKEPEIIVNKKGAPSILKNAGYHAVGGAIVGGISGGLAGAAAGAATGAVMGAAKGAIAKSLHSQVMDEKVKAIKSTLKSTKKKAKRSHDELSQFLAERRAFCPSGSGGGIDNSCGTGKSSAAGGKYMEWDTKKDHKSPEKTSQAQEFIDNAREEQMSKGGKDEGMADEGGGVQTWSKGDHFPWTPKQVGTDEGYVQGLHPDGSKTEKYPFSEGKTSDAFKKMGEEIKRRKGGDVRKRYADLMEWTRRSRAS
jgi:HK97 family phage prohead protease